MSVTPKFSSKKLFKKFFVVILLFLCFITIEAYGRDFTEKYQNGEQKIERKKNRSPIIFKIEKIQAWMTFDYINTVFKLPPNYLKNQLGIQDTRYPYLVIDRYARKHNINPDILLLNIRQSINMHMDQ